MVVNMLTSHYQCNLLAT